jgi:hypothetical protein
VRCVSVVSVHWLLYSKPFRAQTVASNDCLKEAGHLQRETGPGGLQGPILEKWDLSLQKMELGWGWAQVSAWALWPCGGSHLVVASACEESVGLEIMGVLFPR